MIVNKTTINIIRNSFKLYIEEYDKALEEVHREYVDLKNSSGIFLDKSYVDSLNKRLNIDVSRKSSKKDVLELLYNLERLVSFEREKTSTILSALTREGIKGVTYSLPFMLIQSYGREIGYAYLIVTGIKNNAKSKPSTGKLLDPIEEELRKLELIMGQIIRDDYSIDENYAGAFIVYFSLYLEQYYNYRKEKLTLDENFDFDKMFNIMTLNMSCYIVESNVGRMLSEEEQKTHLLLQQQYATSKERLAEAITRACKESVISLRKKDRLSASMNKARSTKEEVIPVFDAVDEYIVDGVVSKECDLDEFERLLSESRYSSNRRLELLNQMRNLKNKRLQGELDRKLALRREALFSKEEMQLYLAGKENVACNYTVKDIDEFIEMTLEDSSEEDLEIIHLQLDEYFEILRAMLTPVVKEDKPQIPKIVFFKDRKINDEGEVVETPVILKNIIASQKGSYKQVNIQLSKLMEGMTVGDKELCGNRASFRVWFKGRDFKTFYTKIGDLIIVIDGMKGDDAFGRINATVIGRDFIDFMKGIRDDIQKGMPIDDSAHLNDILTELNKGKDKASI